MNNQNLKVFVLDKYKNPLMPCSSTRARELLNKKKAVVHKFFPFTIRLKNRELKSSKVQSVSLKFDPGSKTTGIGILRENKETNISVALWQAELSHRGDLIKKKLHKRAGYRRRRRSANLRYRPARFLNRPRPIGWLAPSGRHRVDAICNWAKRLQKLIPMSKVWVEDAKFDTQLMENPEISGIEYQQGDLQGYEVKEYLLKKYKHKCVYCEKENKILNIEHVVPRAVGGSNRINNLVIACIECNQAKGKQSIDLFLKKKPELLKKIKSQLKASLKDAAAMNSIRKILVQELSSNFPVKTASGAQTKFNRSKLKIPKSHSLDALCVGDVSELKNWKSSVMEIVPSAHGRGSHQRNDTDITGFPRKDKNGNIIKKKGIKGQNINGYFFQAGSLIKINILKGKYKGTYIGRLKRVRGDGSFTLIPIGSKTEITLTKSVLKNASVIQNFDGYKYNIKCTEVVPQ